MNYDHELQRLITAIKADKSIVQPWKNYALKHLYEAQAHLRMGLTTTNMSVPAGTIVYTYTASSPGNEVTGSQEYGDCICPPGGKHKECPVHGWQA